MDVVSYIIVGSGYRAKMYARIAAKLPHMFRAIMLCRSEEKARNVQEETGIRTTCSINECLSFGAQFAVIAVNKGSIATVCAEWAGRGYAVLTETPAASTPEQMNDMWQLLCGGAKIAVCEQYHRFPCLAAGIDAVARGTIGEPYSAYLSIAHDYHAASLLRRLLCVGENSYEIRGCSSLNKIVETASREGRITDGRISERERDLLFINFNGRSAAVYDFSGVQYRSFIRSRTAIVRGSCGEWNNGRLFYVAGGQPYSLDCRPLVSERHRHIAEELRLECANPFDLGGLQDEFAVASILYDMPGYIRGGIAPYSLEEALKDCSFWLDMQRATANPWECIKSQKLPWME